MTKIDSNKKIDINQYKDPWDKEMHNFALGEEDKFMEWFFRKCKCLYIHREGIYI